MRLIFSTQAHLLLANEQVGQIETAPLRAVKIADKVDWRGNGPHRKRP